MDVGKDPMLIEPWSYDEAKRLLDEELTMSTKDVCRALKCSRGWVHDFVRPNVPHMRAPRYLLSERPGDEDSAEIVWYSAPKLKDVVYDHARFFARTKRIPVENWVKSPAAWRAFFEQHERNVASCIERDPERALRIRRNADALLMNELSHHLDARGRELLSSSVSAKKRKGVEEVRIAPFPLDFSLWQTVADIKDYGDSDELVYRRLFREGAIRVQVEIPGSDGTKSKKVYYLPDPKPIAPLFERPEKVVITVPYSAYLIITDQGPA